MPLSPLSHLLLSLCSPEWTSWKRVREKGTEREREGKEGALKQGMNRMSGVSLGRIRKRRMRDWLDAETSRGRDRRTGLNK